MPYENESICNGEMIQLFLLRVIIASIFISLELHKQLLECIH